MDKKFNILIVDDEQEITNLLKEILEEIDSNYNILIANNYSEAEDLIIKSEIDLALLDIWLDDQNEGIELLKILKMKNQQSQAIMISGHGNISIAVQSIKLGAFDYIEKPIKSIRLKIVVKNAVNLLKFKKIIYHQEQIENKFIELVGQSKFIKNLKVIASEIAKDNRRIFINGEIGTGKTLFAKYIHKISGNSQSNFILITKNLNKLNETNLNENNYNTIFFQEITDFPINYQTKVLNFINENQHNNNLRIIASSSKNINYSLESGAFLRELYLRLNTFNINMLNLNDRIEDIPDLCNFFINYFVETSNLSEKKFSNDAIYKLQNYQWHENILQLKSVIEWILITYNKNIDKIINSTMLSPDIFDENNFKIEKILPLTLKDAREEFEKYYLTTHLRRNGSSITKTAEAIGLDRSSLHRKLKSLNITFEDL